jgi:hypothetical protein
LLTTANLSRHNKAIHSNNDGTPRGSQAQVEFDLAAIGAQFGDEHQGSIIEKDTMDEELAKIVANAPSRKAERVKDWAVGGQLNATGVNERIASWEYNFDDAPIGWRLY